MFLELQYINMLEITTGSGSIGQYWSEQRRRCIPSIMEVLMIPEIE